MDTETATAPDARGLLRPGGGHEPWPLETVEQSIQARFEAVVRRFGDRPAVIAEGHALTYADLDQRSAALARSLEEALHGLVDRPVALLLDQSIRLPAAVLGVLRTGAPFVPVDPAYPASVLTATLDHAAASAIIADSTTVDLAYRVAGDRPVIHVDVVRPELAEGWSPQPIGPRYPATLFYTSGSTGRPKAVLDDHRNVLHNVRRYTNSLAIGPDDRLTVLHAPTSSGMISSLFAGLLNGAVILPFDLRHEGLDRLSAWLLTERATILHSTPAVFRGFARHSAYFPGLRLVRLEGDLATWADVARFRRHVGDRAVLVNGLGTTETGLVRQYFVGHDWPSIESGGLPIGYPVDGAEVLVTADDGGPAGPLTVGELVVRGRYLALGYWRDKERTDAAFTPDLLDPEMRSYRTGDLGRAHPDGRIDHLGRRDLVHKIRGQTVDPGLLEAALLAQPGISEAIAITRDDGEGEPRLMAYLVPDPDGVPPDLVAIRRELKAELPAVLVPSSVVVLEALPLTSAGKVDRSALPAPDHARPTMPTAYLAPRDPLEEQLVAVWEAIIGVCPVGVDDGFFDLGGDSLAAATMLLDVGATYGRTLGPSVLDRVATVAQLARELRDEDRAGDAVSDRLTIFAIHPIPGLPTFFHAVARQLPLGVGLHSLQPTRSADGSQLHPDVVPAAAGYVDQIRAAQPSGPYHLAGFCYGGLLAFEAARQIRSMGEEVGSLVLLGVSPLDFPTLIGPAARARYRRSQWRHRRRLVADVFARDGIGGCISMVLRGSGRLARRAWLRQVARRGRARQPGSALATHPETSIARYDAQPFDGDVTVILGRDADPSYVRDPDEDLSGLTTGRVTLVVLPGDDNAMLSDPMAARLAAELADRVAGLAAA
jgi:amino acid adenylation domain-containing protein